MQNNKNKEYDQHIITALKKLPDPLTTFDGRKVFFDVDKRNETIYEHIANKKHHLHCADIIQIPEILKNKECLKNDRNGARYKTYIGRRKKQKEKNKYLKIVTKVKKNKDESIITICTVKNTPK